MLKNSHSLTLVIPDFFCYCPVFHHLLKNCVGIVLWLHIFPPDKLTCPTPSDFTYCLCATDSQMNFSAQTLSVSQINKSNYPQKSLPSTSHNMHKTKLLSYLQIIISFFNIFSINITSQNSPGDRYSQIKLGLSFCCSKGDWPLTRRTWGILLRKCQERLIQKMDFGLDLLGESSCNCLGLGIFIGDSPIIGYINTFYVLEWNAAGWRLWLVVKPQLLVFAERM